MPHLNVKINDFYNMVVYDKNAPTNGGKQSESIGIINRGN